MKLTREGAIIWHRKMWNWIADEIEREKTTIGIWNAKKAYLQINGIEPIFNDCFLCEYARCEVDGCICILCPLLWGENQDTCVITTQGFGLFEKCVDCKDWQEQAALARQIANLPERNI